MPTHQASIKKSGEKLVDKIKRGDVLEKECPSREILRNVTSKWGVLTLLALYGGDSARFSVLRRRVSGISEKMLSQTLQALEADGFIKRTAYQVTPLHVEYSLTIMGEEVAARILELAGWIEVNVPDILEHRQAYQAQNETV
ncbi:winged helix-turn-helix transcriptional regulator [Vibrio palustris]|uniref:Putative HTH-type transcriptional regulator YybR n=1 Tax=Vibrio palustris TaxID=1918946 RepID=A0A1R4B6W7_9VIBR|nr:helix-turn-helix domain-containing protein [Vibrio palustris]SJL84659.1 putative HTH-type transcriptional regulator YybR [Vibrio palustris]